MVGSGGGRSVAEGLTGLAQLAARNPREALALDLAYARRTRFGLDCRVIAMSFVVNVLGKARARRLFFGDAVCDRRSSTLRE